MNFHLRRGAWRCHAAVALMACAFAAGAQAAPPERAADASIAQQERARCLDGRSGQDRDACLREVGAAQQERQRGTLADGQAGQYGENAMRRCDKLPAAEQADCRSRARGEGQRSGSVAGGGVLKETVTHTVGQPVPVVPAASAASSPASDPAPVR